MPTESERQGSADSKVVVSRSNSLDELDLLAFRFFKLFAQYESALKGQGFVLPLRDKGFKVDWDRFANDRIGPSFLDQLSSKVESARYLLDRPPMKQVLTDGYVEMREVENTNKSVQSLFGHMSRVRNNLFHGAKFDGTFAGEWVFDKDRTRRLLTASLEILEHFKDKVHAQ